MILRTLDFLSHTSTLLFSQFRGLVVWHGFRCQSFLKARCYASSCMEIERELGELNEDKRVFVQPLSSDPSTIGLQSLQLTNLFSCLNKLRHLLHNHQFNNSRCMCTCIRYFSITFISHRATITTTHTFLSRSEVCC